MQWTDLIETLSESQFILVMVLVFVIINNNVPRILAFLEGRKKGTLVKEENPKNPHVCTKEKELVDIPRQMRELDKDMEDLRTRVEHESTVNDSRHEEFLERFNRIDKRMDDIMKFLMEIKLTGSRI